MASNLLNERVDIVGRGKGRLEGPEGPDAQIITHFPARKAFYALITEGIEFQNELEAKLQVRGKAEDLVRPFLWRMWLV